MWFGRSARFWISKELYCIERNQQSNKYNCRKETGKKNNCYLLILIERFNAWMCFWLVCVLSCNNKSTCLEFNLSLENQNSMSFLGLTKLSKLSLETTDRQGTACTPWGSGFIHQHCLASILMFLTQDTW